MPCYLFPLANLEGNKSLFGSEVGWWRKQSRKDKFKFAGHLSLAACLWGEESVESLVSSGTYNFLFASPSMDSTKVLQDLV